MKAVRVGPSGAVEVVELPTPMVGPGEALMRTRVAGICGSDLLDWYVAKKAGTVLGHEVSGEIVSVGAGVEGFRAGDRVAPHHHAPCLACVSCAAGRYVHCAAWKASRLDPGGMAELVRIPAGNLAHDTRKVPDGVSDEEASFVEPLATVVKAFRRGRFTAGQSAFFVGLGPTGQLGIRLARAAGASLIAGAERVASRIEAAGQSGAAEVVDVSREGIAAGARRLSGGSGFDFVFVGPGKREVVREAFEATAAGERSFSSRWRPPASPGTWTCTISTFAKSRSFRRTPADPTTHAKPWTRSRAAGSPSAISCPIVSRSRTPRKPSRGPAGPRAR